MGRRSRGDGSVYFDAARGCWVGVLDIGRDAESRRRRRRKVSAPTKTECSNLIAELRAEFRKTGNIGRRNVTVEQIVRDHLTHLPASVRSPITARVITDHGERIIASIGRIMLAKLTVAQVEDFLRSMAAQGYSTSTITRSRSVLRRAIRRAERDGLIARNVADLADVPSGTLRVSRSMTREQAATLLRWDLTVWWRAYITTGLMLGPRPGELLQLTWANISITDGTLKIRGPHLKTESSRRTLKMPGAVRLALVALKRQQAADRLRLGEFYADTGLVFCDDAGQARDPQEVRKQFRRLCVAAGIGRFTPRELRHTFVSLMSDSGVSIDDIADLAGHINAGVTRTVYRHQIADKLTAAASVMDDVFRDVSGS